MSHSENYGPLIDIVKTVVKYLSLICIEIRTPTTTVLFQLHSLF